MSERLNMLHALGRIRRALRQEARMQSAYAAERAERNRIGRHRGRAPASVQALHDELQDEIYFFMLAVRQAISSRRLLADKGFGLPPLRMESALIAWRDILEHWDDAPRGQPIRAEARWRAASTQGDPGSWFMFINEQGIVAMSGVSMLDLRDDLMAVLRELTRLEAQAFEEDWPTLEAAAGFMHMDVEKFERLSPWGIVSMDWSHREAGVRYRRSDLEK